MRSRAVSMRRLPTQLCITISSSSRRKTPAMSALSSRWAVWVMESSTSALSRTERISVATCWSADTSSRVRDTTSRCSIAWSMRSMARVRTPTLPSSPGSFPSRPVTRSITLPGRTGSRSAWPPSNHWVVSPVTLSSRRGAGQVPLAGARRAPSSGHQPRELRVRITAAVASRAGGVSSATMAASSPWLAGAASRSRATTSRTRSAGPLKVGAEWPFEADSPPPGRRVVITLSVIADWLQRTRNA